MHNKFSQKQPNSQAYHHGNLQNALVDAALEILKKEGIQALSLRKVARHAGVSQTAPYSHFKDKKDLLAAVATRGFFALGKAMEQESLGAITEKETMLGLARGYVNFAVQQKALFRLMFGAEIGQTADYPELAAAGTACHQLLSSAVGQVLDAYESPKTTQVVGTLAAWSLVHGLATLLVDGKADTLSMENQDEMAEAVASLLVLAE